jgi:hypothetical protein
LRRLGRFDDYGDHCPIDHWPSDHWGSDHWGSDHRLIDHWGRHQHH